MIDPNWLKSNPKALDAALARRGEGPVEQSLLELDTQHRSLQNKLQDLQTQRNSIAKEIGLAKQQGQEATDLTATALSLKEQISSLQEEARHAEEQLFTLLSTLPNPPLEDVPLGMTEEDATLIRTWGTPRNIPNPKDHVLLGEGLGLMSFEQAARISGARFVVLKSDLARLERALASFMLDIHTREFGYVEISPPLLVRQDALFGTGNLPKFGEDLFQTNQGHYLIPTAEVSLSNLHRGEILSEEALPLRYTAFTPCFRAEAGAAGKDTHGMIRQHQFGKVELVSLVRPEDASSEHERMTEAAQQVLKRLELPHRVILLPAGDTGFQSCKTYDIEVWLPGQERFREISSCSQCGTFQARRMNTRFRRSGKPEFVHTLNGSGVAVGRALIAILENFQNPDGSISLPPSLLPYMGGIEKIASQQQ